MDFTNLQAYALQSQPQNRTPQQKLAAALMQPQKIEIDQRGQFSPMQGAAQLLNSYAMAKLWNSGPSPQSTALQQAYNQTGQAGPTQTAANILNGNSTAVVPNSQDPFQAAATWQPSFTGDF